MRLYASKITALNDSQKRMLLQEALRRSKCLNIAVKMFKHYSFYFYAASFAGMDKQGLKN